MRLAQAHTVHTVCTRRAHACACAERNGSGSLTLWLGALGLMLSVLIASAGRAEAFSPPVGCQAELTVQMKGCLMLNMWTCDTDAEGTKWLALFNDEGPSRIRKVDAEFQWLETYLLRPSRTETMVTPAPDPESLTVLFAEGYDTYDFTVIDGDGRAVRYVGDDRLTGESVVIDGEPLLRTEFSYSRYLADGSLLDRQAGAQYVSERHRLFFFSTFWNPDAPNAVRDYSPIDFIYPGEAGFFPNAPIYECGQMMSNRLNEDHHDKI